MLKIRDDEGKVNVHVFVSLCTKLYKNTIVISEELSKNGEIKTWLLSTSCTNIVVNAMLHHLIIQFYFIN